MSSPIEVIPAGRVKLVNPLQPENALMPIEVIPSGRVKLVNPLQSRNAYLSIEVIPAGRFKLVNLLQPEYLQPIITQYFIDNKSEIWLLFLIAHSKR
jgi:hypothetical protein